MKEVEVTDHILAECGDMVLWQGKKLTGLFVKGPIGLSTGLSEPT